jgi:hypothetical protein
MLFNKVFALCAVLSASPVSSAASGNLRKLQGAPTMAPTKDEPDTFCYQNGVGTLVPLYPDKHCADGLRLYTSTSGAVGCRGTWTEANQVGQGFQCGSDPPGQFKWLQDIPEIPACRYQWSCAAVAPPSPPPTSAPVTA